MPLVQDGAAFAGLPPPAAAAEAPGFDEFLEWLQHPSPGLQVPAEDADLDMPDQPPRGAGGASGMLPPAPPPPLPAASGSQSRGSSDVCSSGSDMLGCSDGGIDVASGRRRGGSGLSLVYPTDMAASHSMEAAGAHSLSEPLPTLQAWGEWGVPGGVPATLGSSSPGYGLLATPFAGVARPLGGALARATTVPTRRDIQHCGLQQAQRVTPPSRRCC